jgi:hypothetical protein
MKNKFLETAGVATEEEFYNMFPSEEAFFQAYPQARQMKKGGNVPTNPALYSRVKSEAKQKFDRWPSAYGSAWLVKTYKKRGGGYRKGQFGGMMGGMNPENPFAGAVNNIMRQDMMNNMQGQGNNQMLSAAMQFAPMLMGMPPMADGGKMPAWLAEKRFKAAGNADKLDDYGYMYGGDTNMMGYGGNYMQEGGSLEEEMMSAGRQMAPRISNSQLYSGMPKQAKYNTLYDAVNALGFNPSFGNRKKLFNSIFNGKYTGTAKQNNELLKLINSGSLDLESLSGKVPIEKSKSKKEVSPSSNWYTEEQWDKAYEAQNGNTSSTKSKASKEKTLEDEMMDAGRSMTSIPSQEDIEKEIPKVPRRSRNLSADWYTPEQWDEGMRNDWNYSPEEWDQAVSNDWNYSPEEWDAAVRNDWNYSPEQWDAAAKRQMQNGGEPDGEMAMGQLMSIMDKAEKLRQFINANTDLEPWVSSKLTMADDYIDGISDYMMYSEDGGRDIEVEEEEEYNMGEMEEMAKGGIPQRYKNKGFNKVGVKRQSTRPGKKWMVLAKKGDKYKVVHGGYKGMKDFSQHGSSKRKDKFWSRMGGKDSAKAKDPFSPLYWHKRFGTWQEGGEIPMMEDMADMYNPYEVMKKGGIYIKPENRGKFTQQAKNAGMGVQEFAGKVLSNKEDYSPTTIKRANFARNAAGWKKEMGGMMSNDMDMDSMYSMMRGGSKYQQGGERQNQIMQAIQMYAQMTQTDPEQLMQQIQALPPLEQEEAIQKIMQAIQQASSQQQMQMGGAINMGDTMELDDTEIQRLMDMGYGVEYID